MGLALVLVVALVAINAAESASGNKLNTEAPEIGAPDEQNHLPPAGTPPTPPPGGGGGGGGSVTAHVSTITATVSSTASRWAVTVRVTVVNEAGTPQQGVTCSGTFVPSNGTGIATDLSDEQGVCVMTQVDMPRNGAKAVAQVTFTIDNLTGTDVTYNPGANGASSITVPRPA